MDRIVLQIRRKVPVVGGWLLGCGCGIQCGVRGIGLGLTGLLLSMIPGPAQKTAARLRMLPIPFWLFLMVTWLAAGRTGRLEMAAWKDVVQWSLLILAAWGAVLLRRDDRDWQQALLKGVSIALAANIVVAFLQILFPAVGRDLVGLLYGTPFAEGGTGPDLAEEYSCGLMRSHLQYCALVLVSLSVLGPAWIRCSEGRRVGTKRFPWLPLSLFFGVGFTVRPAYVIAVIGVSAVVFVLTSRGNLGEETGFCRRYVCAVLLSFFAGVLGAELNPRAPSAWDYVAPFSHDDSGESEAKRVVVEWEGVLHTLRNNPVGYGPGTYAESVRRASAVAGLPKPSQNRVRRDGNAQIQVLLIEVGWLGTLFFLIGIVRGCFRQTRRDGSSATPEHGPFSAMCIGTLVVTAAFTGFLTTGLGPLCCVIALSSWGEAMTADRKRYGSVGLAGQLLCLMLAGGTGLLTARGVNQADSGVSEADSAQSSDDVIVVEVEDASELSGGFHKQSAHDCGRNTVLTLPMGAGKKSGYCRLRITAPATGSYRLWLRAQWEGGCSNSIQAKMDGGVLLTFEDAIFKRWHWVDAIPNSPLELVAGEHIVELFSTEDGIHLDQLALLSDPRRIPVGIFGKSPPKTTSEPEVRKEEIDVLNFDAGEMPREDQFDKYKESK